MVTECNITRHSSGNRPILKPAHFLWLILMVLTVGCGEEGAGHINDSSDQIISNNAENRVSTRDRSNHGNDPISVDTSRDRINTPPTSSPEFLAFVAKFPQLDTNMVFTDHEVRRKMNDSLLESQEWRSFICRAKGSIWDAFDSDCRNQYWYYPIGKDRISGEGSPSGKLIVLVYQEIRPYPDGSEGTLWHATYSVDGQLLHRVPLAGGVDHRIRRFGTLHRPDAFEVQETWYDDEKGALSHIINHRSAFYQLDRSGQWRVQRDEILGEDALHAYLQAEADHFKFPDLIDGEFRVPLETSLPRDLLYTINDHLRDQLDTALTLSEDLTFNWAEVNLDQDEAMEALVVLSGLCGSNGCALLVMDHKGYNYNLVSEVHEITPPIYVLNSSHNGWSDLACQVNVFGQDKGISILEWQEENGYPPYAGEPPSYRIEEPVWGIAYLIGAKSGDGLHRFIVEEND